MSFSHLTARQLSVLFAFTNVLAPALALIELLFCAMLGNCTAQSSCERTLWHISRPIDTQRHMVQQEANASLH